MSAKPWNLEPLDLGGILDTSVRVWRAHFKALFVLAFGLGLIGLAISKGLAVAAVSISTLQAVKDPQAVLAALSRSGSSLATLFGLLLLGLWISWIGAVCGASLVVRSILGEPVTIGSAVTRGLRRASTATWAAVLMVLWCLGVGIAAAIPFVVLAAIGTALKGWAAGFVMIFLVLVWCVVILGVVLWLWIRFLLLTTVLAAEDEGGFESLLRSGRLISGRVGPGLFGWVRVRAGVLVTVLLVILSIVGLLAALPTEIVAVVSVGHLQSATTSVVAPQAWMIPAELLGVAIRAVFSPLLWVFAAVFYLDMRSRREGLDLQRQLDSDLAA